MNEELEQPFLKCRESGSRWQSRILETDTARVPRPSPKHAHVTLELVFVTAKQSNVPPTHTHPTHAPSPIQTTFTAPLSHALCWGSTGAVLVSCGRPESVHPLPSAGRVRPRSGRCASTGACWPPMPPFRGAAACSTPLGEPLRRRPPQGHVFGTATPGRVIASQ